MAREPLVLDLTPISTAGLGTVLAALDDARLRTLTRRRKTGSRVDDDVITFVDAVYRLVALEALCREQAIVRAEREEDGR